MYEFKFHISKKFKLFLNRVLLVTSFLLVVLGNLLFKSIYSLVSGLFKSLALLSCKQRCSP